MTSVRSVDDSVVKGRGLSVFHVAASCHHTASDKFVLESFLDLLKSPK